MNRKSRLLFCIFASLSAALCAQIIYLYVAKSMNFDMVNVKTSFVSLVGLSDLAISTEASYIRHRSISDLFSVYKDDGSLREYFPSTYVYSHSNIINKKGFNEW